MIIAEFIHWYYYTAPLEIIAIWQNYLAFSLHFFGIRYHLATFFRPWRLITLEFDEPNRIRRFFLRTAGRAVGVSIGIVMRLIVIFAGITTFFVVLLGGILAVLLWLLLPAGLILTFIQGVYLLI
jgi:hypothetical protein